MGQPPLAGPLSRLDARQWAARCFLSLPCPWLWLYRWGVGSSGGVMGLFGGKLAEVVLQACERCITKHDHIMAHEVRREHCCIVTTSVILVVLFSFIMFVDWAAHFPFGRSDCRIFHWLGDLCLGHSRVGLEPDVFCCQTGLDSFALGLQFMYSGEVETIEDWCDVCGYYKQNFEDYECNCMREGYNLNGGGGVENENRVFYTFAIIIDIASKFSKFR
jgi:hypothetical protein